MYGELAFESLPVQFYEPVGTITLSLMIFVVTIDETVRDMKAV